jgi:hypothetical protein
MVHAVDSASAAADKTVSVLSQSWWLRDFIVVDRLNPITPG